MIDEIKRLLDKNNHLSFWSSIIPNHCQVISNDYYTKLDTGVNLTLNNGIYNCKIPNNLQDPIIQEIVGYFNSRSLPFIWILNKSSSPSDLKEKLLNSGFNDSFCESGMALNLSDLPNAFDKHDDSIEIVEVDSFELSQVFTKISIEGFGIPYDQCYDFLLKFPIDNSALKRIIAYINKTPVGVGLVLLQDSYAVFHNIAVIPQYRKKGVGTQISLSLLNVVKNAGKSLVILHASQAGEKLYQKLGFLTYNQQHVLQYSKK